MAAGRLKFYRDGYVKVRPGLGMLLNVVYVL